MRKHIKTLICLSVIAILAVFGGVFVATNNFAAPEVSAQEVSANAESDFTISGGMITGYTGTSSIVEIPSTINGQTVKGIGQNAFSGKSISRVTLPTTCTIIAQRAFQNCSSLIAVERNAAITTIEAYAFYNCTSLRTFETFTNLTTIGAHAFYSCINLTTFYGVQKVASIGDYAFYNCTRLRLSQVFQELASLGRYAFAKCISIDAFAINKLATIPAYAFNEAKIKRFEFNYQLQKIEEYAFLKAKVAKISMNGSNNYFQTYSFGSTYGLVTSSSSSQSITGHNPRTLILVEFDESVGKIYSFTTNTAYVQYYGAGVFAGLSFKIFTISNGTYNLNGIMLSDGATFDEVYYNTSNANSISGSTYSPFYNATIKYLEISANTTRLASYSFCETQINEIRIKSENTLFDSNSIIPRTRNKSYYVDNLILEFEADSDNLSKIRTSGLVNNSTNGVCSIYFIKNSIIYLSWPSSTPWSKYSKLGTFTKDSQEYLVYSLEKSTAKITASAGTGGAISPAGTMTVPMYDTVKFTTSISEAKYKISDVKVNGVSKGAISPIEVYADVSNISVVVTFEIKTYTVAASAGTGGTITPSGSKTVEYGQSSETYKITPNEGYRIKDVKTGIYSATTSQGAIEEYTFTNVTTNKVINATFEKIPYTITASAGEGGTITPAGETTVLHGADQSYTITPQEGYQVDKLLIDGVETTFTSSPYTFSNVTANHTIEVTFKKLTYTITATAINEGGTITPEGETTVEHGEDSPTYTITPNPGYYIYNVFVNGTGRGASTEITLENVTQDYTIQVAFKLITYTITATAGENGSISPAGEVEVEYGKSKTFKIAPSTGYKIKDVIVDDVSQGAITTYDFTNIQADHTIVAQFEPITYTITATAGENGSISPACEVVVNYGESKTFTFTPNEGYVVKSITIDKTVIENNVTSYTISNVTSNRKIHVEFEIKTIIITATAGENGTISPAGEVAVNYGASQTFIFTPNPGYTVKSVIVNGFDMGPDDSLTLNGIRAPQTVHVEFEERTYIITASAGAGGNISPSGKVELGYGENQTFIITPSTGFEVDDVLIDNVSIGERTTYTFSSVTADHTIEVTFRTKTLTIKATAGEGGTISPSGTKYVNYGSNQTFTITPDTNYQIKEITVNGVVKTNTTSLVLENIKENQTILVTFEKITYTITATAGENGSISPSGKIVVEIGEDTSFTFTPDTGYQVKDVKVNSLSVGAVSEYTITDIARNTTIYVEFEIQTFIIKATAGTGGTISPSGDVKVNYGENQAFTISANTGYEIVSVKVDGTNKGVIESFTFTNVNQAHTIEVTFTKIKYTISASAGVGGIISPSGKIAVDHGASQKFTITPNDGYEIASIKVDGEYKDVNSTYTFTNVTQAHTIEVQFAKTKHTITATAGEHGTITPQGEVVVVHGESQTFEFTPNTGYTVKDIKVDGTSVGAFETYEITNVSKNMTIHVDFEQKGYTITTQTDGNGRFTPSGNVNVLYGEDQTFEIIANQGYVVKDVLVDGTSVGAQTSYTFESVDKDHTISATFEKIKYTITATAGEHGTITPQGEFTVEYGDSQTFEFAPDLGYAVKLVLVNDEPVDAIESYTIYNISEHTTIHVEFEQRTYIITASAGKNGSISPSGQISVVHGESKTFVITPDYGYQVCDIIIDGEVVEDAESYTFDSITDNHTIEVTFEIETFTVNATAGEGGTITPSGEIILEAGATQSFEITPNPGYKVKKLLANGEDMGAPLSYSIINIHEDFIVVVEFEKLNYTITAIADEHGTITPNGEVSVAYNEDQTFEFVANAGYKVSEIKVDGENVEVANSYTFECVSQDHTIEVIFEKITYIITATAGENGQISPAGEVAIKYGETKTFAFIPNDGYMVDEVRVDGVKVEISDNKYILADITDNHTISVSFKIQTFTLTATCTFGGAINPSGVATVSYGESKTYTITPMTGYEIASIKINNQVVEKTTTLVFENITEDKTVEVAFEKIKYTITVISGEHGNITPQTQQVEHGSTITFMITPNADSEIVDVKVDGESKGVVASWTFENVEANHTIEATFAEKSEFKVVINCGENGNITPNTISSLEKGSSQTFTLTPDKGYVVKEVRVNGSRVSISNNTFVVENVQSDLSIEVLFMEKSQTGDATMLVVIFAVIVLGISGVVIFFVVKSTKIKKLEK